MTTTGNLFLLLEVTIKRTKQTGKYHKNFIVEKYDSGDRTLGLVLLSTGFTTGCNHAYFKTQLLPDCIPNNKFVHLKSVFAEDKICNSVDCPSLIFHLKQSCAGFELFFLEEFVS